MRLSKEDALFLYGMLFHCAAGPGMGAQIDERISEMLDALTDSLLGESDEDEDEEEAEVSVEDDDDEEDEEDEEDDDSEDDDAEEEEAAEDEPEAEDHLCPAVLSSISALTVVSPTGEKVTLEFEDVGSDDSVDALLDEGSVIIDGVSHLMLETDSKTLKLHDGNEWHVFGVKKLPKVWSKVLKPGVTFGLERVTEEEEE